MPRITRFLSAITILFVVAVQSSAAFSQTTGTPQTLPSLLTTHFQDSQAPGSITAARIRNFAVSVYPQEYLVTNYGAKCDGNIVYGGVTVSTGSTTVSTTAHTFTAADVGSTVTLWIPPFNSFTSSALTAYTSTISSVSGGNAILAGTPSFSSTAAGMLWYHTVDTVAITAAQTAAHAAGGGVIKYPPGVCVTGGPITFYSNTRQEGVTTGGSTIALANGSNSDLFVGEGYNTFSGHGDIMAGGVHDFSFEHLQLFGNRAANTGSVSNAGIRNIGTGNAIRVFGYQFTTDDLLLNYWASDGWYSEWAAFAGNPIDANNNIGLADMLAHPHDIKAFYNAGYGMVWAGPHDALVSFITTASNGLGGFYESQLQYSGSWTGSPLRLDHFHGYQEPQDLYLQASVYCNQCIAETAAKIDAFSNFFIDSVFTDLTLGTAAGGIAYRNTFISTFATNINSQNAGGFQDYWFGGGIGTVSGGGAYSPFGALNTAGVINTMDQPLQFRTFGGWPAILTQDPSNNFTLQNFGSTQFINNASGTKFITPLIWTNAQTTTNCSSATSPAVCVAAAAGSVAVPTGTNPTLVVNTTAVTATSQIHATVDSSLGAKLGVTCNSSAATLGNPIVIARTAGVSFTLELGCIVATNPACVSYTVVN